MSARTRRGIALSWSVLFILSLLLQYATFAMAPAALGAHLEHLFELDGNAVDSAAVEPDDDWDSLNHSLDHFFAGAATEASANDSTYFTTGGSKDENDIPSWAITSNAVPDKDELTDAYGAVYQKSGDTWVYFGADRFDNEGDAQIAFWFFQNKIGIANGDFTGKHADGDVLVLSEYTNGGVVDLVCAYEWDGSGGGSNITAKGNCDSATSGSHLNLVAAGAACDTADGTFDICAVTNAGTATAPWTFTNKDGAHSFAPGQFFEGGINLSAMFDGQAPCFGSFLAETRSSQETDAQLKDFALGSLSTCVPPTIATEASASTVQLGDTVTDTATLSGSNGPASGTVDFFVCGPNTSATACTSGGTKVGGSVAVDTSSNGGTATSAAFKPSAAGFYCFRAEYNPDADSQYLAGSHTNATTECFKVVEAHIAITKTANPVGPVNAGDEIGFDITVTNEGDGTALNTHLTDALPAGITWTIDAPTGDTSGVDCSASTATTLTCNDPSMAAGDSYSVHIHGTTDANDCGTVSNTASVTTSNDGSDEATATVDVLCAQIAIAKVANPAGPVSAGGTIGFDITVTNDGDGTAHGVVATDALPGAGWTADAPTGDTTGVACGITAGTLTCTDDSMAPGDSFTVHVHRATSAADCGTVDNTASVTTTNDGSDEASASVDVLCPDIQVTKTPDEPNNDIPAGHDIEFTIVVKNIGAGSAAGVTLTDNLPAGFDWTQDNADCDIAAGVLSCDFGTMAAGATETIHLSAPTSAVGENPNIDCSEGGSVDIPNVASASASNEGADVLGNNSDPGDVDVLCSALIIEKSFTGNTNGTDPDLGVPSAKIGDTLHYSLHYSGSGLLENAVITDVLPQGLQYVDGTALGNADFNDGTFDSATRTITWHAKGTLPNPAEGTVTYDVKVLATAPAFAQPLVNVATIDSDQTNPDSDTASVAVLAPPQELTPPPTSTLTPQTGTSNPGFALMLILLGVAAITLTIGFVTPAPASATRRRNRRR